MDRSGRIAIGRLAKRTGTNIETIHYYERVGLWPAPARSAGGYRLYGTEHLKRLNFIRRARTVAGRGVRPADPPRRQTFDNWPDWIRSTSTFHSSFFRTARFPASPMRTSSPSKATSGQ